MIVKPQFSMRIQTDSEANLADLAALPQQQKVVLVMDLVESVRLMAGNERAVVDHWRGFVRHAQTELLPQYSGRMVKSLGDGIMAEFDSPRDASQAAIQLHRYFDDINASLPESRQYFLRAGLNTAQVYIDALDIYGSGVNLAARVASLAGPGETMATAEVRDGLTDGLDAQVEDMGECHLKHVAEPVRAFRIGVAGAAPALTPLVDYTTSFKPAIAIIPFAGAHGDGAGAAVGDFIADSVIAQVSRTADLRVISRLSTAALRGRHLDLSQIEQLLGARYVMSGSFVLVGSDLLLNAELSSAQTMDVVWSDQLRCKLQDLLSPECEIISQIAQQVHSQVLRAEFRHTMTRPLPTLESYSLLIGSITLMHRMSRRDFAHSQRMLEVLIARHPRSPTPRAWLAKWHSLAVAQSWTLNPSHEAQKSLDMVHSALDLDPNYALALTVKALIHGYVQKDFALAQETYASALTNNPSEPLAWIGTSMIHAWMGEGDDAMMAAERALALSPLDPIKYYFDSLAGTAMLVGGDLSRSIDLCGRSLRVNGGLTSTRRVLAIAQALSGNLDAGKKTAAALMKLDPGFTVKAFKQNSPLCRTDACQQYADALFECGVPID